MKPEIRKKHATKTKALSTTGANRPKSFGFEKWKKTILKARKVRMPVSAGRAGLRCGLAGGGGVVVAAAVWSKRKFPRLSFSESLHVHPCGLELSRDQRT